VPQVRVVGEDGEQFGVLETRDAIRRARELGMDLVEVAPNAEPPVCKIIDFGKFQYEAKKKANEAKKKQVVITVKEIKFRPGTDVHDYTYRMKRAREWLAEGNKIKATIWFRGREMTHRELGSRILEQLEKDLIEVGDVEMRPRMEGNQMFTIFAPKKHGGGKGGGGSHQSSPARAEAARPESPRPEPARLASPPSAPARPESPPSAPAQPESEPKTEPKVEPKIEPTVEPKTS
jgi:translation initiation factor IF-3